MSDSLIEAGLDSLRISIQGVNSEKYRQVTGIGINVEKMAAQIRYFYEHKYETKLYVKIMDAQLDSEADKQRFFDLFGDICDNIGVEHLVPMSNDIDYSSMKNDFEQSKYGNNIDKGIKVCPFPFYTLDVIPNGDIYPCCYETDPPIIYGNVNTRSLADIWLHEQRNFQLLQLKSNKQNISKCSSCPLAVYCMQSEDIMDGSIKEILKRY
jgi:GTP 3',8-cyclase